MRLWKPRLTTGSALVLLVIAAVVAAWWSGLLGFLGSPTSWQLGFSVLPQEPSDSYGWTLWVALLNTLVLGLVSIATATILGAAMALLVISGSPVWAGFARAYIQLFRNMPLILQAMFWFSVVTHLPGPRQALSFAGIVASNRGVSVPFLTPAGIIFTVCLMGLTLVIGRAGKRLSLKTPQRWRLSLAAASLLCSTGAYLWMDGRDFFTVPELAGFNFKGGIHMPTELIAVLIALTMFGSAYIGEIIRGGFATVPKGVIEAARSLSLPGWVVELKVRAPLAMRAIILPLGSQYTVLLKATSIGLAVGFTDIFAVTLMSINQSGYTVSLLCFMTACFVLLNQALVSAANTLNKLVEIPGHGTH
ncbi:ABC transporter permease subunit [Variovorax sp. VNK109]|jgi:general L-amino acid transport system permease protein|uniref:ABC transporter permease subunit n=1 Tax=Variovorax sp. VNK109 TaxID=3400919 RepID=UPI003C0606B8